MIYKLKFGATKTIFMIDNIDSDQDVSSVKQLFMAVLSIIFILGLWGFLNSVHI